MSGQTEAVEAPAVTAACSGDQSIPETAAALGIAAQPTLEEQSPSSDFKKCDLPNSNGKEDDESSSTGSSELRQRIATTSDKLQSGRKQPPRGPQAATKGAPQGASSSHHVMPAQALKKATTNDKLQSGFKQPPMQPSP